jgi:hypothetical protein
MCNQLDERRANVLGVFRPNEKRGVTPNFTQAFSVSQKQGAAGERRLQRR